VGRRNYLIEGVSCTGKTSVCRELQRRGYHALNGDRELAYQGDPETGEPVEGITGLAVHKYHIWDVAKVKALVADHEQATTFFCGGSRNFPRFLDLLDGVFILDIDLETLTRRLDRRPADDWGRRPEERELILRLHHTKEEIPKVGTIIDATVPITQVVDEILRQVEAQHR
jgi:thymidylate kinase